MLYVFVCCWILFHLISLHILSNKEPSAKSTFIWKLCCNFQLTFKGTLASFMLLVWEQSSTPGSSHYQNADKPKVASQPTTERNDLRHRIPTWEPRGICPHLGLCSAHVPISEHNVALFIYFSFQGAFPIFPSCIPAPAHPISVLTFILHATVTIRYLPPLGKPHSVFNVPLQSPLCAWVWVFRSRGHFGYSVCTPPLSVTCMHPFIYSVYLSGFRSTPTGLHSSMLPGSASGCPQTVDDPHCIMSGISFLDWPEMERKASDY